MVYLIASVATVGVLVLLIWFAVRVDRDARLDANLEYADALPNLLGVLLLFSPIWLIFLWFGILVLIERLA